MIIIDQYNQNARKTKTILIARLFLWLWRQSAIDRGLSVKPGLGHLGHWQTVQTQTRRRRTQRLIWICTVCLNCRKLKGRMEQSSPHSGPLSQPSLRGSRPTSAVSALVYSGQNLGFKTTCLPSCSEKGSISKGKNLLPRETKSFYLGKIPFQKVAKTIWLNCLPWNCILSPYIKHLRTVNPRYNDSIGSQRCSHYN